MPFSTAPPHSRGNTTSRLHRTVTRPVARPRCRQRGQIHGLATVSPVPDAASPATAYLDVWSYPGAASAPRPGRAGRRRNISRIAYGCPPVRVILLCIPIRDWMDPHLRFAYRGGRLDAAGAPVMDSSRTRDDPVSPAPPLQALFAGQQATLEARVLPGVERYVPRPCGIRPVSVRSHRLPAHTLQLRDNARIHAASRRAQGQPLSSRGARPGGSR